ncbi:cyclin-I [Synchiropus splendidus]|uniref:cyclin-I n=1 Tax=Synchiropus splendidus TaxID=270530 RepID=UPI00237E5FFF|nr:cyclin-I [Synchiropus splendidus]
MCVWPGCSLAGAVVQMKNPATAESRRLLGLLEEALVRERRLWKVPVFKSGHIQGTDISSSQHREIILWLLDMNRMFQFCPETFALGVCVLNRLLSTVKAQPKYLKCIAFTSLVLAAKINEEDEVIGSVGELVAQSGCNFSTAEILRMERIILDKLQWDLYTSTPVDFVHIVSWTEQPRGASKHSGTTARDKPSCSLHTWSTERVCVQLWSGLVWLPCLT